jgi:hypothetical protein
MPLRYGILFTHIQKDRTKMNTTGKSKRSRQRVSSRVEQVLKDESVTMSEVLLWQTWQLHAALRKRLLGSDLCAVRMVDALVSDFFEHWQLAAGYAPDTAVLVKCLADGREALGEVLPDEEAYALMRAPVEYGSLVGAGG